MNYKVGQILRDNVLNNNVSIANIVEEVSPVGKIFCFELQPIGFTLPKNANYYVTQVTLEKFFTVED